MKKRKFIKTNIEEYINEEKNSNNNLDIYNVLEYLTPSFNEKIINIREQWDDLINRFNYLIPYFFEQKNIDYDCEEDECEDFIYDKNLETDFEDWIIENFEEFYFEDYDIPSWYYFKNPKIIKGTFIHFSDNVDDILKYGFTKGIDDITILGMTTLLSDEYKKSGGLNFAYFINDLKDVSKNKYGKDCIMFEGIGIRAYHKIDKEYEVIFNPKDISNIRKCE